MKSKINRFLTMLLVLAMVFAAVAPVAASAAEVNGKNVKMEVGEKVKLSVAPPTGHLPTPPW